LVGILQGFWVLPKYRKDRSADMSHPEFLENMFDKKVSRGARQKRPPELN
jgi:hypothetical protein